MGCCHSVAGKPGASEADGPQKVRRSYIDREGLLDAFRNGDIRLLRATWLARRAGFEVGTVERGCSGEDRYKGPPPRTCPDYKFRTAYVGDRKGDPKVLPYRQLLEAEDPSAFLPFEELVAMVEAVSEFMTPSNAKLPVISVSYCWEGVDHPDPEGRILVSIAEKLGSNFFVPSNKWVKSTNARGYADFGIFLDWCSVHQKPRSAAEDACFKRALRGMNLVYAHHLALPLIIEDQDEFLQRPRAVRGWPVFEEAMSFLLKDKTRVVGGRQGVPLPSAEFALQLESLHFTNGADRGMVAGLYKRALDEAWAEAKSVDSTASGEDLATLGRCLLEVGCPMAEAASFDDTFDAAMPGIASLFKALSGSDKLRCLKINGAPNNNSKLCRLPDSIGQLRFLEELELKNCKLLQELPASIGNFKSLKQLKFFWGKSLKELPASLGDLEALEYLRLFRCSSLQELPASFGNLQALKEIDMGECTRLKGLPASFGNLKSLQKLDVSRCAGLKELPASMGNLQSLQKLVMYECTSLKELPASIGNLQSLQELDMHECAGLKELPASIGNLPSLQLLDMSECKGLKEVPASLGDLKALKTLLLCSCTGIKELPASLGRMEALKALSLPGCTGIQELPASLGDLKTLKELDLTGCKNIQEIPQSIVKIEIEKVMLRGCPAKESFERSRDNLAVA